MKYNTLRKSLSICASILLLINAGGATLKASAKHYSHRKIAKKITRKHLTRYQYVKNYRYYQRIMKRIKNNQKRLRKLRYYLRRHKYGRLHRNLMHHRRAIVKNLRYNQRIAKKLRRNNFNFVFSIKINKRMNHKKKIRKVLTPEQKAKEEQAYQSENAEYIKENNANVMTDHGLVSESQAMKSHHKHAKSEHDYSSIALSASSVASSTSSNYYSQSSGYDINSEASALANSWYNMDYGQLYYSHDPETIDALAAYAKNQIMEHPDANANNDYYYDHGLNNINFPTEGELTYFEDSNSIYSPNEESEAANNYISTAGSYYNKDQNYWAQDSANGYPQTITPDNTTFYDLANLYAGALGYNTNNYSYSADANLPSYQDMVNIVNSAKASSAINYTSSVEHQDAVNWANRNNIFTSEMINYNLPFDSPAKAKSHSNNYGVNIAASGTDAAFNNALNTDASQVENGDDDGFNGIENYM